MSLQKRRQAGAWVGASPAVGQKGPQGGTGDSDPQGRATQALSIQRSGAWLCTESQ